MILADKIIEERKRIGLSQEELAEKLEVSRQSVSKWEGAQSVPDINRIIRMAEIFGVSTDYLLKDDVTRDSRNELITEISETVKDVRHVSMEEATDFINTRKKNAPFIALGVSMCILSPVLLITLAGLSDNGICGIPANLAEGIGVISLLLIVAFAVLIFIRSNNELKRFEYLEKEEIETLYGVDGMAREKRTSYEGTFNRNITIGVIICILCAIPLLIAAFMSAPEYIVVCMVSVLLAMVSVAVNLFVNSGMIKNSYDMLLQEGDYTVSKKSATPILERVSSIYWLSTVAIYLAISFISGNWDRSWIVWPVAGVLFAVVMTVTRIIIKVED